MKTADNCERDNCFLRDQHRLCVSTSNSAHISTRSEGTSRFAARPQKDRKFTSSVYKAQVPYTTIRAATPRRQNSEPYPQYQVRHWPDSNPPQFYLPEKVPTITKDKQLQVDKHFPVNTEQLDEVTSLISQQKRAFDV
jgi:hypothetical protein